MISFTYSRRNIKAMRKTLSKLMPWVTGSVLVQGRLYNEVYKLEGVAHLSIMPWVTVFLRCKDGYIMRSIS
jgi:hypothetical protein